MILQILYLSDNEVFAFWNAIGYLEVKHDHYEKVTTL